MRVPNRAMALFATSLALSSLCVTTAHASDHVVAKSSKNKLQVLAAGGAKWCDKNVKLKMVVESDSPVSNDEAGQLSVMGQLKKVISSDCSAAETAELTVVEASGKTTAYRATAAQGWSFARAVPITTADKGGSTSSPSVSHQPAATPVPEVMRIPAEVNYNSALLLAVRTSPDLLENQAVLEYWARHRFQNEYRQQRRSEFQLEQLRQRAKADLTDAIAAATSNRVTLLFGNHRLDEYDFKTKRFPISLELDEVILHVPAIGVNGLPGPFAIQTSDSGVLSGIPMDVEAGQQFTRKRTDRWGNVNRTIHIAATIEINPNGFERDRRGALVAKGSAVEVAVFDDEGLRAPVYRLASADIGAWRAAKEAERIAAEKAEAERRAEIRRQELIARRDAHIRTMSNAPLGTRMANFIAEGEPSPNLGLHNLRGARATAAILNEPVRVRMLVQTKGGGRSDVATDWPGNLNLSVADGHPELSSGTWYLVEGQLDVPAGEGGIQSRLAVQKIYACTKAKCAEATDPTAIVDRKLASLSQAGVQQ